jgi:CubicO group peptidase (beta-lactamase class C family)
MNPLSLSRFLLFFVSLFLINTAIFSEVNEVGGEFEQTERVNSFYRLDNSVSDYEDMHAFDSVFDRFMHYWRIRGASVALVNKGKLVYAKGYGFADFEQKEPVTPNHLFRVASLSKLITAVAIMKLVENKVISLDDQVFGEEGILADSTFLNIADKRVKEITVRHLLNHTGGWSSRVADPLFMPSDVARIMKTSAPPSFDVTVQYMLKYRKLSFKPGTRSNYSNFGYGLLGKVIEVKTGLDYETYVNQAILYPLGIYDMTIGGSFFEQRKNNEVKYYVYNNAMAPSVLNRDKLVPAQYGGNYIEGIAAAGGWIASSISLMRFLTAIDGWQDIPDILMEESIKEMTTNDNKYVDPLGWRGVDNNDNWWRTGSLSGTSALLYRQNDSISWVVLLNTSTWKGPSLPNYIYASVKNSLALVDSLPNFDLFYYHKPVMVNSIKATKVYTLDDFSTSGDFIN